MAIKEWSTNYSGASPTQDPDPITGNMPDLTDESFPGAGDGDAQRSSQVEAPRNKLQVVCKYVGDSVNSPTDSLHAIIGKNHTQGAATQFRLYKRTAKPTSATDTGFLYAISSGGYLDLMWENPDGSEVNLVDGGISVGYDDAAVHVDESGEIYAIAEKLSPIGSDVVVIEDSASSWAKKRIAISTISPLTTKGDIFGFDTANARIPVGADGYLLTADSAEAAGIKWAEAPEPSPLTTKGDLFGFDTANARIPIGADGYLLTADSTEATGIKWAEAPEPSPLTTKGDLFGFSTANDRVPVGPDGYALIADSGEALGVKWGVVSGTGSIPNEEEFSTAGTETPGDPTTFGPLTNTPRGSGTANTPSGYDILVFRNGLKMKYEATPTTYNHYYYDDINNEIDVLASGDADEYEVVYGS